MRAETPGRDALTGTKHTRISLSLTYSQVGVQLLFTIYVCDVCDALS